MLAPPADNDHPRPRRQPFRGRPPPTGRSPDGTPVLAVVPTPTDARWRFSDAPAQDDSVYYDMIQRPSDLRTPDARLRAGLGRPATAATAATGSGDGSDRAGWDYDSQEIGIQCFDDGRWPERTDLRCWWCLHGFETRPFPCPVHVDPDGRVRIRGVFCGPSCAKAWAIADAPGANPSHIDALINALAKLRGFRATDGTRLYIPPAPPREALAIFCGGEGMTIAQFRGMCASGFNVTVLRPPFITEKQVIVAECDRMVRMIRHQGRVGHVDAPEGFMVPAAEYARRRREGLEIFAGVGARRLTDYLPSARAARPPPPPPTPSSIVPAVTRPAAAPPNDKVDDDAGRKRSLPPLAPLPSSERRPMCGVRNGRMKRPLPQLEPTAARPPAKRRRPGPPETPI
jgi:hypothetical protein